MVTPTNSQLSQISETVNMQTDGLDHRVQSAECRCSDDSHVSRDQDAKIANGGDPQSVIDVNDGSRSSLSVMARDSNAERLDNELEGRLSCVVRFRKCSVDTLPFELLADILLCVAIKLEDKVSLSLVCKRFRSILMSFRKLWEDYWLINNQTPEEIVAIAEGQGFSSLKASLSAAEDGGAHVSASTRVIMSLRPGIVELVLDFSSPEVGWKREIEQSLRKSEWPTLQTLEVYTTEECTYLREFSEGPGLFEGVEMSILQNITTPIIPGVSLGENLLRCSIDLTHTYVDLNQLFAFLSSPRALRELEIAAHKIECSHNDTRHIIAVDMRSLESFAISISISDDSSFQFALLLIQKTNMPALLCLKVNTKEGLRIDNVSNFGQELLRPFPTIRKLELDISCAGAAQLAQAFFYIPRSVEVVLIRFIHGGGNQPIEQLIKPIAFRNHCLREVQFKECEFLHCSFMANFVEFLRGNRLLATKIVIHGCETWGDGVYTLDTVRTANVGTLRFV